ncbi:MAG TPA: IS3 family transposase [Candidatus Limnocylindrales bacterium]|nr:IS3 family transposase [Candidatus Limnocylindrales bacterium]
MSRYQFIAAERKRWPVSRMCAVLAVSVSGFYDWVKRPPSRRAQANKVLATQIVAIHAHSRQTYGYLRIHAQLQAEGARVGKHRVARLMRQQGLQPRQLRRWRRTTQPDQRQPP